jgi:hypothetical protein
MKHTFVTLQDGKQVITYKPVTHEVRAEGKNGGINSRVSKAREKRRQTMQVH